MIGQGYATNIREIIEVEVIHALVVEELDVGEDHCRRAVILEKHRDFIKVFLRNGANRSINATAIPENTIVLPQPFTRFLSVVLRRGLPI